MDTISSIIGNPNRPRIRQVLEEWRPFLHKIEGTGPADESKPTYRLYHQSFRDFIAAKDEVEDERIHLKEMHQKIADQLIEGRL